MQILQGPSITTRPERQCAGIRVVTPFPGMFAVRDKLLEELYAWLDVRGIEGGHAFFRLHVVDMTGPMDVEVGVVTENAVHGDGRVRSGVLPAGQYATLTYINHGRQANRTLIEWVRARDLALDCVQDRAGDRFGCRYEAYLTDPRTERMRTRWRTELAIRLADRTP